MTDPFAFLALPIAFQNICNIYPPKINDILMDKNYPVYKKCFLNSQEDIEDEWADTKKDLNGMPTPLEYLFLLAAQDPRLKEIIIQGFKFFIHEDILMLPDQKMIIVGDMEKTLTTIKSIEELRIIKEDNFFEFQNLLRRSIGEKEIEPYNPNEHPKVRYFKAKARLRDRVKAKNAKDGLTLGTILTSICCMGLGITPLNIGELSQSAVSAIMRTYQEKNKYEIDIKSLLAGGDKKKIKPQFWIRNIDD